MRDNRFLSLCLCQGWNMLKINKAKNKIMYYLVLNTIVI